MPKFEKGNKAAEKWTEENALALGQALLDWMKEPQNIFFEEFLVVENDYYDEICKRMNPNVVVSGVSWEL